jgi:hypothetical protein
LVVVRTAEMLAPSTLEVPLLMTPPMWAVVTCAQAERLKANDNSINPSFFIKMVVEFDAKETSL